MYVTKIVSYDNKAKKLARRIAECANEMERDGFSLVMSTTVGEDKAVLTFFREGPAPEAAAQDPETADDAE